MMLRNSRNSKVACHKATIISTANGINLVRYQLRALLIAKISKNQES